MQAGPVTIYKPEDARGLRYLIIRIHTLKVFMKESEVTRRTSITYHRRARRFHCQVRMIAVTSTVAVGANCVIYTRRLVGMCRLVYKLTSAEGFTVLLFVPGVLPEVSAISTALAGNSITRWNNLASAVSLRLSKR